MKNYNYSSRPVITQVENNTTLWIGHFLNDPADHFAGQTFQCPAAGVLDNIQLFSSAVPQPGKLELTLHEFDENTRSWGPAIGQAALQVNKSDDARWLRFPMPAISLVQGNNYGFRLQTRDAMIGLGEAATGFKDPFNGQEWKADSINRQGYYYSYFSLTYKVELCA